MRIDLPDQQPHNEPNILSILHGNIQKPAIYKNGSFCLLSRMSPLYRLLKTEKYPQNYEFNFFRWLKRIVVVKIVEKEYLKERKPLEGMLWGEP